MNIDTKLEIILTAIAIVAKHEQTSTVSHGVDIASGTLETKVLSLPG